MRVRRSWARAQTWGSPTSAHTLAVAAAVALAVAVAGCSDDDSGPSASPRPTTRVVEVDRIPVLEHSTSGPGTALGDGFTVPDGALLVGVPFPVDIGGQFDAELLEDAGWQARLLVTGVPRDVIDDLARQATDAGIDVPNTQRCELDDRTYRCSVVAASRRQASAPSPST